jgi:hypothetical protein
LLRKRLICNCICHKQRTGNKMGCDIILLMQMRRSAKKLSESTTLQSPPADDDLNSWAGEEEITEKWKL